jgi:hypothetical protein
MSEVLFMTQLYLKRKAIKHLLIQKRGAGVVELMPAPHQGTIA